jgi:hypothetical protein
MPEQESKTPPFCHEGESYEAALERRGRESRQRKIDEALRKGICISCKKSGKKLDFEAWCADCSAEFREDDWY